MRTAGTEKGQKHLELVRVNEQLCWVRVRRGVVGQRAYARGESCNSRNSMPRIPVPPLHLPSPAHLQR